MVDGFEIVNFFAAYLMNITPAFKIYIFYIVKIIFIIIHLPFQLHFLLISIRDIMSRNPLNYLLYFFIETPF